MMPHNSSSPRHKTDVIHVLVADSTLMGNQLLAAALERDRHFCVVGTAENAEQVLAALRSPLDVVVVSATIGSRHSNGFHLTRSVRVANPDVRVITLLDRPEPDLVVESFRAGASGVFCRAEPLEVLWNCIQSVYEGKIWANNDELRFVVEALASSTLPRLTAAGNAGLLMPQEQKVVGLVAEGLTNRQIADELNLSQHTSHLADIDQKESILMCLRSQRGCLRCTRRKTGPSCWEFLWRENDSDGNRTRRTAVIGTVEQFPTRDLARAAVNSLRMSINQDRNRQGENTQSHERLV